MYMIAMSLIHILKSFNLRSNLHPKGNCIQYLKIYTRRAAYPREIEDENCCISDNTITSKKKNNK